MARSLGKCALCGEEMCEYVPSILYFHEAMDRAGVAVSHFYDYVEEHPTVVHDPELAAAAEKVTSAMANFYGLVGTKYCDFEDSLEVSK